MKFSVRAAGIADLAAINAIYNYYVASSTCTYQEEPTSELERAAWFAEHDEKHPVIVAIDADGEVVGWGSLGRFHPRSAYRMTVEDSVYVHADRQRAGIGRAVLRELMERARELGHREIIGLVSADQAGSLALHREAGFVEAGRLCGVGYKFGRWLDLIYVQYSVRGETGINHE